MNIHEGKGEMIHVIKENASISWSFSYYSFKKYHANSKIGGLKMTYPNMHK